MSKPPVRQDPLAAVPKPILPEVEAQLGVRERRRQEEGVRERQRQAAERKQVRPKATYDLPLPLIAAVGEIAGQEDVAQSDVVALALARFVETYRTGQVDLTPLKERARSLRVSWKLRLPVEFA